MPEQPIADIPQPELSSQPAVVAGGEQSKIKRFFAAYWRKRLWTIPLTLLVILGVLAAIPFTRYALTGWFWKEPVTITVLDSQNHSRVSHAFVKLDGNTIQTDKNGQAVVANVHVGDRQLAVEKKYYKTSTTTITVPLFARGQNYDVSLEATGRLATVMVTDQITGQALAEVSVDAGEGNRAQTDKDGMAHIVIPATLKELPAKVTATGYNDATVTVKQDGKNDVQLVPAGSMYFLSKQSGNIDVVKTGFDGSNREVILAGTGNEDNQDTTLLASRDWKYLALKAKREAGKPVAIYLIDTATGGTTTVDQGDAQFTLIGWSNHQFLYSVERNTIPTWQAKHTALKSLDAASKTVKAIDENSAVGDESNAAYETFSNFYIVDNLVAYSKDWAVSNYYNLTNKVGKQAVIATIRPDGSDKKTLKSFPADQLNYITARLYKPQEVYFAVNYSNPSAHPTEYLELSNGTIEKSESGSEGFDKEYPTYLVSPSGNETFWAESRDGKNTLFVGGKNAENGKQLATGSDYTPYGWMTEKYLLLQKNGSELYITTRESLQKGSAPLKISDYHKPKVNFAGYGYGYGGQ